MLTPTLLPLAIGSPPAATVPHAGNAGPAVPCDGSKRSFDTSQAEARGRFAAVPGMTRRS
ncbi:hypothetical protein ASG87_07275 [Frateuria sp. Soil773]|uniref:hypothetical protein n=1 Tax=Frateuria sp. Soil773 TaxID=1736407 RepID=UPI0006FCACC0|nr:hypothetical protein [Frateuria sp. Soil773]KRE88405.1 hypothetical protein ASG87_07275 [Frateuria sp. Soil773]